MPLSNFIEYFFAVILISSLSQIFFFRRFSAVLKPAARPLFYSAAALPDRPAQDIILTALRFGASRALGLPIFPLPFFPVSAWILFSVSAAVAAPASAVETFSALFLPHS